MKCYKALLAVLGSVLLFSCNDFLDVTPPSNITPKDYLNSESDLSAYTVSHYPFPKNSGYGIGLLAADNGTDNQATSNASGIWKKELWHVPNSGGGWDFGAIREINYFLEVVEPRLERGEISGNQEIINHYIGEAYFLRAYQYFNKLKQFGDFPIIVKTLPDKKEELVEASKRKPRNEVARFILSDLDKAISMLKSGPVKGKNRISKEVAQLFKSRVALYEGTWLKYHAGTPFVPGGPGWPGAKSNPSFSLDIEAESNYFLTEAMNAAKAVADVAPIQESNHQTSGLDGLLNPYFFMFADQDMSSYSEVLLWASYNSEFGTTQYMQNYLLNGGGNSGYTRSLMESFLMKNGLPIYAAGSGYHGDRELADVKQDRDERLQLFLMAPGELLYNEGMNEKLYAKNPPVLDIPEQRSVTGYPIKKGVNTKLGNTTIAGTPGLNGTLVFRSSEAYLNYIEADYVKNHSLDANSMNYWKALRRRAGLPEDYMITVNATDLAQENDWAKYSGDNIIDATLYNIRRERRCEFIAEGMRWDDLKRWRALDRVQNYQIEGINLWDSMKDRYVNDLGESLLKVLPQSNPNVSAESLSKYLRPYQKIQANNEFYDGYTWTKAHYLSPIAYSHFLNASDGDIKNTVIYQNPYWPIEANGLPEQ